MGSNSPVTFQRTLAVVIVLLLYAPKGNTSRAQAPQSAEPTADFAFRFDFKPCAGNTLDTYTNQYIREMEPGQPTISIPLTLSAEQMATVFAEIVNIHFFDYPPDFKRVTPGPDGYLSKMIPSTTYRLEVRSAGIFHAVSYDDGTTPRSDEANRLLNLFNLIIGFVNDHPDVKRLPAPRAFCE
jgi:hypothetical protein